MHNTFYVFSQSEADENGDGAGWWSNEQGWTNLVGATRFTRLESTTLNLPMAKRNDARWVSAREAYGCESQLERYLREVGRTLQVGGRQFEVTSITGDGDTVLAGVKSARAEYTAIRCNNSRVAGRPGAEVWSVLGNGKGRQIASFAVLGNAIKALT